MNFPFKLVAGLFLLTIIPCKEQHLFPDPAELKTVVRDFENKRKDLPDNSLPVFVIADTFNRVVFISQGYTIGLGEQLMKTIHKL